MIIPFKEEIDFIALAKKNDLFVSKICRIKGSQTAAIKRSLLEFSFQKREQEINLLIIENQRHHYTAEYQDLVKDFYLKM